MELASRVLVVDGDPASCAALSEALERAGYRTQQVRTGEEALRAAGRQRPALVITETHLPGMSGYEIVRELRERYGEHLPIIFVSAARTEETDRVAGLLLGADDYVIKPFDPDELLARVRRMIVRSGPGGNRNGAGHAESFGLTGRELQILALLAGGLSQSAIAAELVISPKTVATHIQRILVKLGVHSRAEAVAAAHREGLARPQT
jgi:DNA-binding response OmpR family regulator